MLNVPEDSLRYFNEAPKEHEQIAHKPNITYNLVIIHQKALCFWDKCVNMLLKLAMNEANGETLTKIYKKYKKITYKTQISWHK